MKQLKLLATIAVVFLAGTISTSTLASADPDNGKPFQNLQNEINNLQNEIANIQLTPGPTGPPGPPGPSGAVSGMMWIDHLGFLPGDSSVQTSFNAVNSGVGGGLSGLVIQSTTTGDTATGGGNKVVETAVQVPPGNKVTGVTVCYELSNSRSYIDQIRLAQVQNPPSTALVLLDDATPQTNQGPICINSHPTSVDPTAGPLLLSLRVNFADTSDKIVVRGIGLNLVHS